MTQNPAPMHLEVKQGEVAKRLFMSYGLLNRLAMIVGGADQLPAMANSPETQEAVLLEVFTERPKGAASVRPGSLDDLEVGLEDVGQVLDWVASHITHFFLTRTEKAVRQAAEIQTRLQALPSSVPGLGNSPSMTPAA